MSSPSSPLPPTPLGTLGRYTLDKKLGAGGMATVFLAHHGSVGGFRKNCVVKVIADKLADEEKFTELFLREARLAARLNHNNVVQVFDLGVDEGRYFMAMEHLQGVSLADAAKRMWAHGHPLHIEAIVRAGADAALGLHHAHTLKDEAGLVTPLIHRDVSPDNLFLSLGGVTKVLDFGIAKGGGGDVAITKQNELRGKVPFMAPEYIEGDAIDGGVDLFALGVTLYWLLGGRRPFRGANQPEIANAILAGSFAPLLERNPDVPASTAYVVEKLLERDRKDRYENGAKTAAALLATVEDTDHAGSAAALAAAASALESPVKGLKIRPPTPCALLASSAHGSAAVVLPTRVDIAAAQAVTAIPTDLGPSQAFETELSDSSQKSGRGEKTESAVFTSEGTLTPDASTSGNVRAAPSTEPSAPVVELPHIEAATIVTESDPDNPVFTRGGGPSLPAAESKVLSSMTTRVSVARNLAPSDDARHAPSDDAIDDAGDNALINAPDDASDAPSGDAIDAPSGEASDAPSDDTSDAPHNDASDAPADELKDDASDAPADELKDDASHDTASGIVKPLPGMRASSAIPSTPDGDVALLTSSPAASAHNRRTFWSMTAALAVAVSVIGIAWAAWPPGPDHEKGSNQVESIDAAGGEENATSATAPPVDGETLPVAVASSAKKRNENIGQKTANGAANRTGPSATSPQTNKKAEVRTAKESTRTSRKTSASKVTVKLIAPASVEWLIRGKSVGRGTLEAQVSRQTKKIVARSRGGTIVVPVLGQVANFNQVPTGMVNIRVVPWAVVTLGGVQLGTTPMRPIELKAGTYRFTLVAKIDGKTKRVVRQVEVLPKKSVPLHVRIAD